MFDDSYNMSAVYSIQCKIKLATKTILFNISVMGT